MRQLIAQIAQKHTEGGIIINPPAGLSDITDFEKQIGFSLPEGFRSFYLTCNGFGCDEDMFNMITLAYIRGREQDYGNNWFYFCEYMTFSDMWGLRLTPTGHYEIFNGSYPEKSLTSSLTEFLETFHKGNVFESGGLYEWHDKLGIKEVS